MDLLVFYWMIFDCIGWYWTVLDGIEWDQMVSNSFEWFCKGIIRRINVVIGRLVDDSFINESMMHGSWLMAQGSWLMVKGGPPWP